MKIQSSTVAMEGRSTHVSTESESTMLRTWSNKPGNQNPAPASGDRLTLSTGGLSLAQSQLQIRQEEISSASILNLILDGSVPQTMWKNLNWKNL